jgi:hypothetical protein
LGATAVVVAAAAGRGAADWAFAADGAERGDAPGAGSGVMMLTGGIEAEDGKSAVVGLPVGTDCGSAASVGAAGGGGDAFHDGE